jgi:hypothetical protein
MRSQVQPIGTIADNTPACDLAPTGASRGRDARRRWSGATPGRDGHGVTARAGQRKERPLPAFRPATSQDALAIIG